MSDSADDRIHPATPARQQTVWRDGDFAKSFELAAAVQLIGCLVVAVSLFGYLADWLKSVMLSAYSRVSISAETSAGEWVSQTQTLLFSSIGVLGMIGLCLLIVSVLSHWLQTGIVFLGNKVSPDVGRLSPRHWLAKLFSQGNLVFTFICLPKIVLALAVMVGGCWIGRDQFFEVAMLPADELGGGILRLTLAICGPVAAVLVVGAGIDYWMKYLAYQNRIRMTEQELREETKMQSRKGTTR